MINNAFSICNHLSCTGCGACRSKCPKQCISMVEDKNGFLYPSINYDNCVHCYLCKSICPNNISFLKNESSIFYLAIHKDKTILKNSSSGGAFSALANLVFMKNGVVYGACKDEDGIVFHTVAQDMRDLEKMRLSKYYQSDTRDVFNRVLKDLSSNRFVLFTGVACQVAALYSFIPNKYYDKLITVDVLCHGVSSKRIFDSFKKSMEIKYKKKIVDYSFRQKDDEIGWSLGGGTKMRLFFDDGTSFIDKFSTDPFFMAFNGNIVLRESCYECKYCGTERISDFTLADFWGVSSNRVNVQQMKEGVSLLLCNSSKARLFLDELKAEMFIEKIDPLEAIPHNNALTKPNERPEKRDWFLERIMNGKDFYKVLKRVYPKACFKRSVKRLIIGIIGEKKYRKLKKHD